MVYVLLPNPGQSLGVTRDAIKNNFVEIQNSFDVNHIDFDAVGAGKHKFVEMPVQATPPVTIAAEGALFTKTVGASSQVFYIKDAGIAGTEYQVTGFAPGISVSVAGGQVTWSPLAGGLVLLSGSFTSSTLLFGTFVFGPAFTFTTALSAVGNAVGDPGFFVASFNTTSISWQKSAPIAQTINFFMLGTKT